MGEGIRDRLSKRLEPLSSLRIEVSHGTIIAYSSLALILFVAFIVRILPLRWENLSSGVTTLNEFDPYYQLSITQYMTNHGLLSPFWPTEWRNMQLWYPFGLNMGATALPGIPITGAAVYDLFRALGANINLITLCALIPPVVGVITVYIMYLLGKDIGGKAVGLLSALFLALAPSIIERTSLGFYDTEVPGTLGLVLFVFFFLRSVDSNRSLRASILYSLGAAVTLAYFIVGWGGAYYMVDVTVLFVFVMLILRRYSQRLLLSYSITFGLALFIATKVPYLGLSYLTSGAVIPVAGGFVLLLIAELLRNNISLRTKVLLALSSLIVIVGAFAALFATGRITGSGFSGKFSTVLDPFIRASSPIINSVAEQQLTAWGNIYVECGVGLLFFLIGMYFVLKNPTSKNVFFVVFAVTALFFAASMIRLLAIFDPAFAVIAAIGIMGVLKPFYTLLKEAPRALAKSKRKLPRVSKEYSGVAVFLIFMILVTLFAFSPQTGGVPRAIEQSFVPTAISASSLPIGGSSLSQPVSSWIDALAWIKSNVPSNNVVVAWWDYGDWLSDIGNVTTLCDNTTYNSTQIANVGFIMMGNETQSMIMLNHYEDYNNPGRVNYILVFVVLAIEQSSGGTGYTAIPAGYGDEGKFVWMARISGTYEQMYLNLHYMSPSSKWKDETTFGSYSNTTGQWTWNSAGQNCTLNELMYDAAYQYCNQLSASGLSVTPSWTATLPTYFTPVEIFGENVSPYQYGGLVPLVALYKVNYSAYYKATGATGTG
ncbi:MAG TPA: STT3 domain-containing protein [Candidatus Limnocylindrales bacterium]|nr:STT3 domain-containing protein [Candidatus Limnocylindrales bacterium]